MRLRHAVTALMLGAMVPRHATALPVERITLAVGCRYPEVFASVVQKVSAPAVRKSLRRANASCQAEDGQGDLPLLVT